MEKSNENEEVFSEFIPNPSGVANKGEESKKLQSAHNRWKKEVENRRCENFSDMSYWQMVRAGTML